MPSSGGTFSSTTIEIIKWVKNFAVAQAKVTHILRPGKPWENTPKEVIPPSLCEISQNAKRKKNLLHRAPRRLRRRWDADSSPRSRGSRTKCSLNPNEAADCRLKKKSEES
jgi:hypothetical protein